MACSYKYSSCVVWLFSSSSSVTEFKGISVNMMLGKWGHLVNIKVQRALKIPDFLVVVSQQFLEFIPWYVLLQVFFLKTVTDWLQKWHKNLIFNLNTSQKSLMFSLSQVKHMRIAASVSLSLSLVLSPSLALGGLWKPACLWTLLHHVSFLVLRKWKSLCRVWLFETPWTVAHQPLSTGVSRQECSSGLPFPPQGDLPDPGIELRSLTSQADSLVSEPPGKLVLREAPIFLKTHLRQQ